jgi:hypothetical protein
MLLTWLAAMALAIGLAGAVDAAPMIQNLFPTGFGYTSGSVPADSQDGAWKVAAWAAGGTFQPGYTPTGTSPYAAYVFESNVPAPLGIPDTWLGGNANEGFAGGLWIGLQNSPTGIINTPTSAYVGDFRSSMVLSTTFVATEAGTALLDFWASSDNAVAFFVGGTITTSTNVVDSGTFAQTTGPGGTPWQQWAVGADFPTIVGGQQIGFGRGFSTLTHYTGYANVTSGTNTLYAVVYDSVAGSDNDTGFMFTPVPEPSSIVLAGVAVGCIAYSHHRSRRRRRPQSAGDDSAGHAADGGPTSGG